MAHRWRNLAQARWPWAIAAAMLGIHGLVAWAGGPQHIPQWYLALGLRREAVLSGDLWQLLTYAWLHGSWGHALINGLCVLVLGGRVEHILGPGGFLKTLAAGVVGGALGHLVLADGGHTAFPLVGISGACVALLLVITTLSPQSRMLPLPVSGRNLGLGMLMAALLLALADPKLGIPGIAGIGRALVAHGQGSWFMVGHACHLGGGLAGYGYAKWLLRPGPTLSRLREQRQRREARQQPR
ncbi:MAG: rhomboid family intramembrane serine protease [Verrucomicrobiota bacterium]